MYIYIFIYVFIYIYIYIYICFYICIYIYLEQRLRSVSSEDMDTRIGPDIQLIYKNVYVVCFSSIQHFCNDDFS